MGRRGLQGEKRRVGIVSYDSIILSVLKTKIMEPKILMVGRTQEVIDILIEELQKFERNVVGSPAMASSTATCP